MRRTALALSGLLFLAAAPAAFAAPAVNVTIGADLQSRAASYGEREFTDLSTTLRKEVEKALARPGAAPVQRVDLVIESAVPNRPTFNQLTRRPGLSIRSIGLGGATVTGQVVAADGSVRPISYNWYETNLLNRWNLVTWDDAYQAFDMLASRIARGDAPTLAAYKPDRRAGDFGQILR